MAPVLFFTLFGLIALVVVGVIAFPFVYPLLTRGKGTIEIILPRTKYSICEVVDGSVAVTSRRPMASNKLSVVLVCQRFRERRGGAPNTDEQVYDTIVRVAAELEDARSYAAGERHEYPFSLRIPDYVEQIAKEGGLSQRVLEVGVKLLTGVRDRVEFRWYVEANWDVEGLDLRQEQKLTVTFPG